MQRVLQMQQISLLSQCLKIISRGIFLRALKYENAGIRKVKCMEDVICVKSMQFHLIGHGFHDKDKKSMTSMTVDTDGEDEQFREKAITCVYCHSSEKGPQLLSQPHSQSELNKA